MPIKGNLKKARDQGREPKVLLLGSGGLSIGQAGEFDYSGTQAIKALREEGLEVIVVNPNIATVQTNPDPGCRVYLYPLEVSWIERIIEKERPDGIIAGFGGQTALNCLLKLDERGILEKYGVENLGTSVRTLRLSEDRELFAGLMQEIGMPIPASVACTTVDSAVAAANRIGYPVIVRAAYALGGLGSGFAATDEELVALTTAALVASPQVLVEKSLRGWKELEYEVMRDGEGNTITICNMENFDPLGIHTGDSIVVAPSQSLSDDEYQMLRNASLKIVQSLGVVGECNVQFALSPTALEFCVIEVNARLSRSSALASKATGYPIAYIAAKVVLGYDLLELKNPVTGITYAFFEPALDYITVKVPRWDLNKFFGASRSLGSTMKSVGEVMAIGRGFPEALQKAVRMVTERGLGLSASRTKAPQGGPTELVLQQLRRDISEPTDTRLYSVLAALRSGLAVDEVCELTRIDRWFLVHLADIVSVEKEIEELPGKLLGAQRTSCQDMLAIVMESVSKETLKRWKLMGFGDEQIAYLLVAGWCDYLEIPSSEETRERAIEGAGMQVRARRKVMGIRPVVKKIDTTAGEYPSPSNYLYLTYGGVFDDPLAEDPRHNSAMVLGSGAYRIGTSVEFDWCAVACSRTLQRGGWRSVIVNCNPETVSTDYNISDRLYFDEMTLERVLDIYEREAPNGVVTSVGGQLPNRLASPLARAGVRLLGHPSEGIDNAEDRERFSAMLDQLGIDQPGWCSATSIEEIEAFVGRVGYPVLVRPSYVLSGAAMAVCTHRESLVEALSRAVAVSQDFPVVVSEFVLDAREIELDGVARDGEILISVVSEHVENAGVHSGDATMVVPAQRLYVETARQVRRAGHAIVAALKLHGPFNIQFLAKSNHIRVIECNARAARSTPFVSKVVGANLAEIATEVMMGRDPKIPRISEDGIPHVGVKAAMFSFRRLRGTDPVLGVEMMSTGEVGCIGRSYQEALLLALEAAHVYRPRKAVLVSAGREQEKIKFLAAARSLRKLGLKIYATPGTGTMLRSHGVEAESVPWPGEDRRDVLRLIRDREVDFVINLPKSLERSELSNGAKIRKAALEFGCSLVTNMEKAIAMIDAMAAFPEFERTHEVLRLPPYRGEGGR